MQFPTIAVVEALLGRHYSLKQGRCRARPLFRPNHRHVRRFDDELTLGHECGAALVVRASGFRLFGEDAERRREPDERRRSTGKFDANSTPR